MGSRIAFILLSLASLQCWAQDYWPEREIGRLSLAPQTEIFLSPPSIVPGELQVDSVTVRLTAHRDSFVTCSAFGLGIATPLLEDVLSGANQVRQACKGGEPCSLKMHLGSPLSISVFCAATTPVHTYALSEVSSPSLDVVPETFALTATLEGAPDVNNITVRINLNADASVWCAPFPKASLSGEPDLVDVAEFSRVQSQYLNQRRVCPHTRDGFSCTVPLSGLVPTWSYRVWCVGERRDQQANLVHSDVVGMDGGSLVEARNVELTLVPYVSNNTYPTTVKISTRVNVDSIVRCGAGVAAEGENPFEGITNSRTCLRDSQCAVVLPAMTPDTDYLISCFATVNTTMSDGSTLIKSSEASPVPFLELRTRKLEFLEDVFVVANTRTSSSFEVEVQANIGSSVWCGVVEGGSPPLTNLTQVQKAPWLGHTFCRPYYGEGTECRIRLEGLNKAEPYDSYCLMSQLTQAGYYTSDIHLISTTTTFF